MKPVPDMTYNVFGWMLSLTLSATSQALFFSYFFFFFHFPTEFCAQFSCLETSAIDLKC